LCNLREWLKWHAGEGDDVSLNEIWVELCWICSFVSWTQIANGKNCSLLFFHVESQLQLLTAKYITFFHYKFYVCSVGDVFMLSEVQTHPDYLSPLYSWMTPLFNQLTYHLIFSFLFLFLCTRSYSFDT
jgi:hypothetical protein